MSSMRRAPVGHVIPPLVSVVPEVDVPADELLLLLALLDDPLLHATTEEPDAATTAT
jgi:hypothetical protein